MVDRFIYQWNRMEGFENGVKPCDLRMQLKLVAIDNPTKYLESNAG